MALAPMEVRKAVSGIHFPASRRDLIDKAHENKAQLDVMAVLQNMPARDYQSMEEIEAEAGRHEAG